MSTRNWTHIIIHHTGAEEKDAAQVRRYHLSLGWRDVGYHYLIERDGLVVPGRGLDLVGAHCTASQMNYKGIGIAVIGNLDNHPILPAQEDAVVQLVRDLMGRFPIPLANVLGHKEVPNAATACPGRRLALAGLRSACGGGGAGGSGGVGGDGSGVGSVDGGGGGSGLPAAGQSGKGSGERVYRVQVGAYKIRKNAENMAVKLKEAGFPVIIVEGTMNFSP